MSCYVLNPKHISILAKGIEKLINAPSMRMYGDHELSKVFRDCRTEGWADKEKIYTKLYKLNLKAYENRYNEEGDDYVPKPFNYPDILPFPEPSKTISHLYEVTAAHYQFLKLLRSYNYQINEDGLEENEIQLELKKVIQNLKNFIINNNEQYDKAKWFI